ncbi:hypothetical protein G6F65_020370 [Rhizopus arrhizus]|nr:hypothetical protein G6F65_020370 [Rhizopus arrhizus]
MGALHRRPGRHPAAGQAGHAGQGLPLHRYPEWRDRHALLIMPIYAELVKTPKGLELAKQAFEKAKPGYHPITTASVQDMLAKAEAK